MIAVYSPHHILHDPPREFISNQVAAYGESPERAELIYESLMDVPGVQLAKAETFGMVHFRKVHAQHYLKYLETAYEEWIAEGLWNEGIMPEFFALGSMRGQPPLKSPLGMAGYYMTDSCTMIVKGTWEAVRFSGYTALTGANYLLGGEPYVFSICRPPGHHAGYDFAGGYCFVNNAALAAKFLQDQGDPEAGGNKKVGILDIDFHHGNGTQDIVRRQENIRLVSIHGDPAYSYPYISGYRSENSPKNINFPLPKGTTDEAYFGIFREAVSLLKSFRTDYLVISLGVDTYEKDTLGEFKLSSDIYKSLAEYVIHELEVPTLIIMEGGYNIEFLTTNVLSFLSPFIRD
ncbi:MAG: histone deacetylase family protein [Bacteroidota bacterium]